MIFQTRDPHAYYYPDSAWQALLIGSYLFSSGGVLNLDALQEEIAAITQRLEFAEAPVAAWRQVMRQLIARCHSSGYNVPGILGHNAP